MRLHAFVFACLVISARAASINPPDDQKLDALDDVNLDEVVSEPEQIEQITVNEVENNLRNVAEIPVSVVEEQQMKKIDENSNDYVPDINESVVHKRAEIDLKNPGPPQRQEHETQNPGYYSDKEKALISVREKLEETRHVFTEQIKSVSTNFETLIERSENIPIIQQKIQNLNSSFTDQIADLNDTIQSYINSSSENLKTDLKPDVIPNKETIQSNLKKVQNNFNHGLSVLSEGVELLAIIKEEDEAIRGKDDSETSPAPATPVTTSSNANQGNFFQNLFNQFSSNVIGPLQNFLTINPGAATQTPPTQGQADEQTSPQGPLNFFQSAWQNLVSATQNNLSYLRPQPVASNSGNSGSPQPSNSVPAAAQNPTSVNVNSQQPQSQSQPSQQQTQSSQTQPQNSQAQTSQTPTGPIQQLLQNNPIIRGIQNAVQRVQSPTTANPSNPREKSEENKDDSKGHYGGNINNTGDNNDVSRVEGEAPQVESLGQDAVAREEVKGEQEIKEKPSLDAEKTD